MHPKSDNDANIDPLALDPGPLTWLRVGLTYNLKKGVTSALPDAEAEFDDPDTILAIQTALAASGCTVELIEASQDLPNRLAQSRPDIVFNVAEGMAGRGRESHVPAILNFLQIPFTGSDETAMCLAMDKALAKTLALSVGVATPGYQVVSAGGVGGDGNSAVTAGMSFPLIVKPNAEGSSKGITSASIVHDEASLRRVLAEKTQAYGQDMLVEEYIDGREFTVGILGSGENLHVFPPMEIIFTQPAQPIYSYEVKRDFRRYVRYACPPDISTAQQAAIEHAAKAVYLALGCRDFARADFRLSSDGKPYFIELNPLPGLAPGYSDLPMLAEFCGVAYGDLVRSVLYCALARYGMI